MLYNKSKTTFAGKGETYDLKGCQTQKSNPKERRIMFKKTMAWVLSAVMLIGMMSGITKFPAAK